MKMDRKNRRGTRALGALLSASLLGGCMGAESMIMMPGSPLIGGIAAAAVMDGMGMMDGDMGYGGAPSVQSNPALNRNPSFSDPELSTLQSRLIQQHAGFAGVAENQLSMAASNGCVLDEDTRWRMAYGMTQAEYYKSMASVLHQTNLTVDGVEAVLVDGTCKNGKPEGAFTAVTRFTTSTQISNMRTTTTERRRVSGTMRGGKLDGEMVSSSKSQSQNNVGTALPVYNSYSVRTYRNGDAIGQEMTKMFISGGGSGPMVTTTIVRHPAPNRQAVTSYTGDMLATESAMVDGQLHGWMVVHPMEYIIGHRSAGSRECYQFGQKAPASACGAPMS